MANINLLPDELRSLEPFKRAEPGKKKPIEIKPAMAKGGAPDASLLRARVKSRPSLTPSLIPPLAPAVRVPGIKLAPAGPKAKLPGRKRPTPPAGPEVNFIPEMPLPISRQTLVSRLIVGAIILLLEVAIISGGYFIFGQYLKSRQKQIDQILGQVEASQKEIESYAQDREQSVSFQNRLVALNTLLDNHIYWTKFLKFLEEQTLPEVFYANAIVEGNRVTLVGRAPQFGVVARQLVVLNRFSDLIPQVSVTGLNLVDQETPEGIVKLIGFNLNLTLKPDWLKQK